MGLRISKIRSLLTFTKSPDVYKKELEGINNEILEMERKNATLEYQYYMITEFIVSYSRLLYLVITLVFFFSTLPSTVVEYIFFCGPVLLFYILICGLKKSLKWYFEHEIKRNSEKLAQLQFRKKNVLSEVKEKMKFKDAKDIIEEYSCVKKLNEGHKCQNRKDVSIPELYLRRKRESSVENVVKYVLSEEKENALICKYCGRHNGLALKEEFHYIKKKKHQRQSISLETKIAILDRLGKGEGSTAIGKHLNLGESTVRAIKKNEAAIRKSVISGTKLSTKFASYTRDVLSERTERAIAIWIEEQVQRRIHVSADEGAAKIFPEKLAKIIEDGDYSADQVFNADETGLYWKRLPNRTYIGKDEKTASGHKESKDRVTLLLCSNASGDRMLKPLLINKSLRPRALKGKDLKQLPVHRMANPKTWMTTAFFTEWFNNCFVPEVEAYMKEKSLDFKVLLIVDNAASHPQLEHPNVQLVFLPPNTTSLIQPLDQGIIATFKKYYIKTTHDDIDELLVDDALSDNDIIDLTLDLTVDVAVGLKGDNDEEEKSTPLTGKLIQEGLQLCSKLENHFLINAPNSERASKLQRELQNCMSEYRELYKKNKRILIEKFNY
ncbi:tigger transposable element-derived protein 1 [Trichonephila clavipes]|uniref:Tigger transposable element-derived protein 1 n=1 Tax=Trichonephila clavipes TaxID=2585209 RepID=A0A8X6RH81_TRICX|nr:tigger transposable element-derived protein 1 [Trichonephila clavipes]